MYANVQGTLYVPYPLYVLHSWPKHDFLYACSIQLQYSSGTAPGNATQFSGKYGSRNQKNDVNDKFRAQIYNSVCSELQVLSESLQSLPNLFWFGKSEDISHMSCEHFSVLILNEDDEMTRIYASLAWPAFSAGSFAALSEICKAVRIGYGDSTYGTLAHCWQIWQPY